MFEKLIAGWKVSSEVRKLVFKDKSIMIYPVVIALLSFIELIAIAAVLFIPFAISSASQQASNTITTVALVLFYIAVTFTSTFLSIAMLIAFRSFLSGKKIGLMAAINEAKPYAGLAFQWALFYGIIVTVLRIFESRFRGVGSRIIGAVGSLALATSTLFVLPVILDEKAGPVDAIKKSADFIVHNLGSSFGGIVYSDIYGTLLLLGAIALAAIGFYTASFSVIAAVVLFLVAIVIFLAALLVPSTTFTLYKLILYEHVAHGTKLPDGISKEALETSIGKIKKGK